MQNQTSEEKNPESTYIGSIIKSAMFSHPHKGLPLWDDQEQDSLSTNHAQLLLTPEHLNTDCLYFGAWIGPEILLSPAGPPASRRDSLDQSPSSTSCAVLKVLENLGASRGLKRWRLSALGMLSWEVRTALALLFDWWDFWKSNFEFNSHLDKQSHRYLFYEVHFSNLSSNLRNSDYLQREASRLRVAQVVFPQQTPAQKCRCKKQPALLGARTVRCRTPLVKASIFKIVKKMKQSKKEESNVFLWSQSSKPRDF